MMCDHKRLTTEELVRHLLLSNTEVKALLLKIGKVRRKFLLRKVHFVTCGVVDYIFFLSVILDVFLYYVNMISSMCVIRQVCCNAPCRC